MADLSPDELRRMAAAIDADRTPRVSLDLDVSTDAAQRLHDILTAVAARALPQAGIEGTWPLYLVLAALERGRMSDCAGPPHAE